VVVDDPDGNDVDLVSPADDAHKPPGSSPSWRGHRIRAERALPKKRTNDRSSRNRGGVFSEYQREIA
jgi:hypothetical protein